MTTALFTDGMLDPDERLEYHQLRQRCANAHADLKYMVNDIHALRVMLAKAETERYRAMRRLRRDCSGPLGKRFFLDAADLVKARGRMAELAGELHNSKLLLKSSQRNYTKARQELDRNVRRLNEKYVLSRLKGAGK